ncbi:thioesterase II family protein [Streptomyces sp. NPDC055607]
MLAVGWTADQRCGTPTGRSSSIPISSDIRSGTLRSDSPCERSHPLVAQSWLRIPGPCSRPRLRLVCFPHAGGSARLFRHWPAHLPDSVELAAVQYPGREDRAGEPLPGRPEEPAAAVAAELASADPVPLALFGHGLGAVLAFETARLLSSRHGVAPRALFVSVHPAPAQGRTRTPEPAEDETPDGLRRRCGLGPEDPEPPAETLYGDLRLAERYRYRPGPPLACPVTALVGTHDRQVTARDAEGWRFLTTGPFTVRAMPGDRFYLVPRRAELVAYLLTSLGSRRPGSARHAGPVAR